MSPSEIAFLALGIVLGAAIGAAIVEAVRSRPAPRREVRLTIAPNSVAPRRNSTLAAATAGASGPPMPGSPAEDAWFEGPAAGFMTAAAALRSTSGTVLLDRTRVLSATPTVPSTAVAVPVDRPAPGRSGGEPGAVSPRPADERSGEPPARPVIGQERPPGPAPDSGPRPPTASLAAVATSVAVLEPFRRAQPTDREEAVVDKPVRTMVIDVHRDLPEAIRPRPPAITAPIVISPAAVGLAVVAEGDAASGDRGKEGSAAPGPDTEVQATQPGADPCATTRVLMDERCAVASTAGEKAKLAADALREAQRAYDTLRERVERAQADGDPRAIAAAKDSLHKEFRAATTRAGGAEDTEAAAREWLTQINAVNIRARDAMRLAEAGTAELRAALPRLERMGVEADAARISAENAEAACREARVQLAACEEAEVNARNAATEAATAPGLVDDGEPVPAGAGAPVAAAMAEDTWPNDAAGTFDRQVAATQAALGGYPVILRILRGDREARDRLVATVAAGDPEAERAWQTRIAQLVAAITARAIEDGYLDMPEDDTFWSLFAARETREIIAALSALGFRYDGVGGFLDERVPAQRDLSLAVGYAGLDRMRIRNWPREQEISELYRNATVASDEWLVHHAGDLSLGEMVDALGPRAGDLAEVWNNWGQVRPALLAAD